MCTARRGCAGYRVFSHRATSPLLACRRGFRPGHAGIARAAKPLSCRPDLQADTLSVLVSDDDILALNLGAGPGPVQDRFPDRQSGLPVDLPDKSLIIGHGVLGGFLVLHGTVVEAVSEV